MKECLSKHKRLQCFSRGGSHTNLISLLPAGSGGWAQLPVSCSRLSRGQTQLAFIWTAFLQYTHRLLHLQSIQIFWFSPKLLIISYLDRLRILVNISNKMTLLISERRSWCLSKRKSFLHNSFLTATHCEMWMM